MSWKQNEEFKAANLLLEKGSSRISKNIHDKEWSFHCDSKGNKCYTIKQNDKNCDCKIRCYSCYTCPHNFSCTCLDSILRSTVCKHIHYLVTTGPYSRTTADHTTSTSDVNVIRILSQGKPNQPDIKKVKKQKSILIVKFNHSQRTVMT